MKLPLLLDHIRQINHNPNICLSSILPVLASSLIRSELAQMVLVSSILTLTACNSTKPPQVIQTNPVPPTVQSALAAKYPGVVPVWEAQRYGYEAAFTKNGIEYEAEFSPNGQWLETEYEVTKTQFPAILLQKIRQKYPDYNITKCEIELTPKGTFYEVEVEKGKTEIELYFDQRGNPAQNYNEDA